PDRGRGRWHRGSEGRLRRGHLLLTVGDRDGRGDGARVRRRPGVGAAVGLPAAAAGRVVDGLDAEPRRAVHQVRLVGRRVRAVVLGRRALLVGVGELVVGGAALRLVDPRVDRDRVAGAGRRRRLVALAERRVGRPAAVRDIEVVAVRDLVLRGGRGR